MNYQKTKSFAYTQQFLINLQFILWFNSTILLLIKYRK